MGFLNFTPHPASDDEVAAWTEVLLRHPEDRFARMLRCGCVHEIKEVRFESRSIWLGSRVDCMPDPVGCDREHGYAYVLKFDELQPMPPFPHYKARRLGKDAPDYCTEWSDA